MSNKMIDLAWQVPLPAHARLALIALADAANDEGICWISNKTLMEKSTAAKSTLGYILATFEKLRILSRTVRFRPENGSQTSSLKKISLPVFSGTKLEILNAKKKFIEEYRKTYYVVRSGKSSSCHEVTGEEYPQCDDASSTLDDTPPATYCDTLEPSYKSSFEKEEEDMIHDMIIPQQLSHIPTQLLLAAIDKAVQKLAKKSPAGYRKKMIQGLSIGDPGWIETVLEFVAQIEATSEAPWVRQKRLEREACNKALENAGFSNLIDLLESLESS